LRELANAGTLDTETSIFLFNPKMSYVSQEVASADPDFWTAKPAAKAIAAVVKKGAKVKEVAARP